MISNVNIIIKGIENGHAILSDPTKINYYRSISGGN